MKKSSSDTPRRLSELVGLCNRNREQAALTAYLGTNAHHNLLLGSHLEPHCRLSTRNLLAGRLAAHLDVGCSADFFVSLLTETPDARYTGFDLPSEYDEERDRLDAIDPEIDKKTFDRLSRLDDDALGKALVDDYGCEEGVFIKSHIEDDKTRRGYYEAVLDHFRSAAAFAKSVGSDSARLWLDALRLLMPRDGFQLGVSDDLFGLNLVPEDVKTAYRRAEEAHARLWIDLQFAALPLPKSAKRAKSVRKAQRKA